MSPTDSPASAGPEPASDQLDLAATVVRQRDEIARLSSILDRLGAGVSRFDHELRYRYLNRKVRELKGHSEDDALGRSAREVGYPEAMCAAWEDLGARVLKDQQEQVGYFDVPTPQGERHMMLRVLPDYDSEGNCDGLLSVAVDLTEWRRLEQQSQRDRMLLRAFMDQSDLMAWLKDERGALVYANRNWLRQFGFEEQEAIGKTDFELFPREIALQFRAHDLEVLGGHDIVGTVDNAVGSDGQMRCWQVTKFPFHNNNGERFVGAVAFDATERVRHDEEIRRLAITDQLSGLFNRRGFFMLAEPELTRARRRGSSCTLLFIDLDGLKRVNDRLGHQAGDAILKLSALILKKVFRESDIVARIGGDEFAVFAPDTAGDADAIRSRLRAEVDALDSNPILKAQLEFSVGLLRCEPDDSASLDTLLSHADQRMYQHKRAKRER